MADSAHFAADKNLNIKYHDNGDGTYSEVVYSGGSGGSSAGSPATGNPTRVGAVTRPVANKQIRTNGQTSDIITDENENQWVREAYAPTAEDNVSQVIRVEQRYTPFAVSTATTTVVKSGAGFIHQIRVLGGTLGTVTVYDNTSASGTIIIPTVTPSGPGLLIEDITFNTGLTIVTGAATIIVGSYR